MKVEVVLLPQLLSAPLAGRAAAVFDVLRATTTMTAALARGIKEIHLFPDLDSARLAASTAPNPRLLCGEESCLAPRGFDLGNSPGQFTAAHRGATLYMSTTNGTRAVLAAREADVIFTAALVNATAVARALAQTGKDIVLLCSGTNGEIAMEDSLGAGAVIASLPRPKLINDAARMSFHLFQQFQVPASKLAGYTEPNLRDALRDSTGGRNIIAAELEADIDFAARLNEFDTVGIASGNPLVVRPLT